MEDKVDLCQNAIDAAVALGVEKPKVEILAAVETVNSKMPPTIDAAALCKMAERGQITGGILDSPLAFDNAISAGLVVGARMPIVLTSRADSVRSWIASCGVAMLVARARRRELEEAAPGRPA